MDTGKTCRPANILELTSVRGFAAFAVVVFHIAFDERNDSIWMNIVADGHLGVDLFFVLSGFILAHVYLDNFESGRFDFRRFMIKRVARIYPLHFVMLCGFIAIYILADLAGVGGEGTGQNWADLPYHVLLVHAWGFTQGHAWNFPSWSVSAEFFAYLCFPLVLCVMRRLSGVLAIALSLIWLLVISLSVGGLGMVMTKMMYDFGVVRIAAEFPYGVALYLVFRRHAIPQKVIMPLLFLAVSLICILAIVQFNETIIVLILGLMILLLANLSLHSSGTFLRSRVLVFLGEISYSTYMVHILFVFVLDRFVGRTGPGLVAALATIAAFVLIYIASVILYYCVERPGRKLLIRRLVGRSDLRDKP